MIFVAKTAVAIGGLSAAIKIFVTQSGHRIEVNLISIELYCLR
jgi:hypothetical protein